MKLNKTKIFSFLGVLAVSGYLLMAALSEKVTYILVDTALTANDTMISTFYDVGGAQNVSIFAQASDSTFVRIVPVYTRGVGGQRVIAHGDSFSVSNLAGATPLTNAKDLRGYGTHVWSSAVGMSDTNLILGANLVGVKVYVNDVVTDGTNGANYVKVGLQISE